MKAFFFSSSRWKLAKLAVVLLAVTASGACRSGTADAGPRTVQPGAPGEGGRVVAPAGAGAGMTHTEADVRFMQGMIVHHAQALAMTSLVPERSARQDVRLLAQRIELSQHDEIALMRSWLVARGESAPDADPHGTHAGHDAPGGLMPGMLTQDEMSRLAGATGREFDRLFLSAMIRHHEGALIMVGELLSTPGAGQESELFQFASHVDSDQRIEIARMRRMLTAGPDNR